MNNTTSTPPAKPFIPVTNRKKKKTGPNRFKNEINKQKSLYKLKVYFNREKAEMEGKPSITFFSYNTKKPEAAYKKLLGLVKKCIEFSNVIIMYNNHTFEEIERFYPAGKEQTIN